MRARLAIVILNYKTPHLCADCLASLAAEEQEGVQVVVVDNASADGSADVIEKRIAAEGWSRWARVIRSPVNGGFAAGNNLGISSLDADAYLLLNSDTIVLPGLVSGLQQAMAQRPDAGLIVPRIVRRGGERDDNTFRFPHPLSEFVRAASTGPITRLLRRYDTVLPLGDEVGEPDWVGFACVLVPRQVIERVGLLDDGFFMYFEDIDYCRRVRAQTWNVLYWPEARIIHLLGGTSQITAEEALHRRAPEFFYAARARYFAKHHGAAGLWLANVCWCAGRAVSLLRETAGSKAPHLREGEGRDIWMNVLAPMGDSSSRSEPGGGIMRRYSALRRAAGKLFRASSAAAQDREADARTEDDCLGARNENPRDIGLLALLAEDFATHDRSVFEPGLWAVVLHRLGNKRMDVRPRLFRAPLSVAYRAGFHAVNWLWGIDLCYTVKLGRRVRLWHHGGMVLGARAIGSDVHIRHNTTFGLLNRHERHAKPVIEDGVDIGVGACVVGNITVGHHSVIGANSVVLRDIPPHSTVMGVPARPARLQTAPSELPQEMKSRP